MIHGFIGRQGKKDTPCRTFNRDGSSVTGGSQIAGAFCDFFTNVGPDLASKVRRPASGSFKDYLGDPSRGSIFMSPTTPKEIELICLGLDPHKGPGHDGFSPSILRLCASEVSVPLSRLINVCLVAGHFPDFLKIARVTPVFKADDPTCFGNY